MRVYKQLQSEHLSAVRKWRVGSKVHGPRAHAAVIRTIEEKGLGVLDMDTRQIAGLAMPYLAVSWWLIAPLVNMLIRWALQAIIPIVMEWLHKKLTDWLLRNGHRVYSSPAALRRLNEEAFGAMTSEFQPIFSGARQYLEAAQ